MTESKKTVATELLGTGEGPTLGQALDTVNHVVKTVLTCGVAVTGSAKISQQYNEATDIMKDEKNIVNDDSGFFDQGSKVSAANRFNLHKQNNRGEAMSLVTKAHAVDPYSIDDPEERSQVLRDQKAALRAAFRCAGKLN